MIITEQKEKLVEKINVDDADSRSMGIDEDSTALLMKFLSKNIYSDGVGSCIREYVSNAIDSTVNAGTNKNVIVKLESIDWNSHRFIVQDFGLGLDQDDVDNVISKYLKSTKRMDNKALGSFGLGMKSGLSVSSSFVFEGIKNGVKRVWMMYEDATENKIDKLSENPSTEPNGVKIIVDYNRSKYGEFEKKVKQQLVYFKNVDITIYGQPYPTNVLFENDMLVYSERSNMEMNISFSGVFYPIDWDKLGIEEVRLPFGVKIGLDEGVLPTINRETLMYSVETKELIVSKINQIKKFVLDEYNNSIPDEFDTLVQYYKFTKEDTEKITLNDFKIDISKFIIDLDEGEQECIKKPGLANCFYINPEYLVSGTLTFGNYITKMKRIWGKRWQYDESVQLRHFFEEGYSVHLISKNVTLSGYYKKFLQEQGRYFITKEKEYSLREYKRILDLNNHPKSVWRDVIKEFQFFQNQIISTLTIDYRNINESPEYFQFRETFKKERAYTSKKRVIENGEFAVDKLDISLRGVRSVVSKKEALSNIILTKSKKRTYIFTNDNKDIAKDIYSALKGRVNIYLVSNKHISKIEKNKKVMIFSSVETIETVKNLKDIKKMATAYLFDKILRKYNILSKAHDIDVLFQNSDIVSAYNRLHTYKEENDFAYNVFIESIVEEVEKTDAFDKLLWDDYLKIKEFVNNFSFLKYIKSDGFYSSDDKKELSRFINETLLFKKLKYPVRYENIEISLTERVPEVLEEIIDTEDDLDEAF